MSRDDLVRTNGRAVAYGSFDVTSLTPHLGAEVEGVDLSQPLDDAQLSDLHRAFADWSVLVFRDRPSAFVPNCSGW